MKDARPSEAHCQRMLHAPRLVAAQIPWPTLTARAISQRPAAIQNCRTPTGANPLHNNLQAIRLVPLATCTTSAPGGTKTLRLGRPRSAPGRTATTFYFTAARSAPPHSTRRSSTIWIRSAPSVWLRTFMRVALAAARVCVCARQTARRMGPEPRIRCEASPIRNPLSTPFSSELDKVLQLLPGFDGHVCSGNRACTQFPCFLFVAPCVPRVL